MGVFVTNVVPYNILTGQSQEVTLCGSGFSGNVSISVGAIHLPAFFVSANIVKFILPYIVAGTYDIIVLNGDNTVWIQRGGLVISDPPNGELPSLGTAARPIILPPVLVDAPARTNITAAAQYRNYTSPASVKVNSGVLTASVKQDSSYLPQERVEVPQSQTKPTAKQKLVTPWGTFINE